MQEIQINLGLYNPRAVTPAIKQEKCYTQSFPDISKVASVSVVKSYKSGDLEKSMSIKLHP